MKKPLKCVLCVLGAAWLLILLRLTVFRNGCFSHGLFTGEIELNAFAFYAQLIRRRNWRYFIYLFGGNIAWFAPAGFFARLFGGRLLHALAAGLLLSLVVEAGQFILGSGVSELDDLILNTLGAVFGYAFGCIVLRRAVPR